MEIARNIETLSSFVASDGPGDGLSGDGQGGDVEAGVEAAAVLHLGSALDFDDGDEARQPQFGGKAPIAVKPVDLARHRDIALSDTARDGEGRH